ncbi:Gfo/Idh/MocA family protein [Halospeciosus flavus]|uniref:Gfo/Idh/MocA family oxidoreductase n=1 Tax=Halospeciosus flavus TaxID=3032283 RepID=A0ABD5Z131_9EURY|nr:Gfo/Idh/MocA family oxidoreductase [Halospeciosus flavus]
MSDRPLSVGVVGVGSMGRNHARVYGSLPGADLVGVTDEATDRAREVASEYGTEVHSLSALLDRADAVSVAVPTPAHADVVRRCIDAGVDVLVEKPFVADAEVGADLLAAADERNVTVQVGHVERFNPAIDALFDLLDGERPLAVEAHRLGPPLDRDVGDGVVLDLMIHDIDVVLALADAPLASVSASGTADGGYATAQLAFEDGLVATLTASRVTQRKVRTLDVTTRDRLFEVDYTDQTLQAHRHSRPEYESSDGDVHYRHESVTERPLIASDEPLKRELSSFVDTVEEAGDPRVSGQDALRAVQLAQRIAGQAERTPESTEVPEVVK